MIYTIFSNAFIRTVFLEFILILGDRFRKRSFCSISIIVEITAIFIILLAFFDYITETKCSIYKFPCPTKDITWRIRIIFRNIHKSKYHRDQKQQCYSQNNSYNHKSDTIPSFFLIFFFTMREHKKDDGTNECIDASHNHQNDYQSQYGQDNILEICVSIDSIHSEPKKKIKDIH